MKLIVGLGNPGIKYQNNRHNAGFMFVDYLFSEFASLRVNELLKLEKQLAKLVINNSEIILFKPQTFMNRSGEEVRKKIQNSKFKIQNLIVVHDDLDIPLGKFKIQRGTGPRLHNGIASIEQHLRTKDFWRVRIGVDNRMVSRRTRPERAKRVEGETYVLRNFTPSEKQTVTKTFPVIFERLKEKKMI